MAGSRDGAAGLHTGEGGRAGTLVQGPWSTSCLAVAIPGAVNDAQGLEVDLVSSSSGGDHRVRIGGRHTLLTS